MLRFSALCLALAVPLLTAGCGAGWRRLEDLTPRALPTRTQVQVWQGGQARVLQDVTLLSDSIEGVPFTSPAYCHSCRVGVAVHSVDSLRVGSKERGFFRSVGLFLLVGLASLFAFQGVGGG